ncbi:2'-5' RNA ligase family protein [Deinococcus sp. PEB2-67]
MSDLAKAHATGYPLEGRTEFHGLQISIEQQPGSVRSGVDEDGTPWETRMIYPYGYIRLTEGLDGDHLDCYVGPHSNASHAYVVDQVTPGTDDLDEQKVMLGFSSLDDAQAAYLHHYDDPRFLGRIFGVPMRDFIAFVLNRRNWQRRITPETVKTDHAEFELLAHMASLHDLTTDEHNTSRGVMVSLPLPLDATAGLAVPGGLPASTLHVTLGYLGTMDDLLADGTATLGQIVVALKSVAERCAPLRATLHTPATFPPGPNGKAPQFLNVSAPGLTELRAAVVEACTRCHAPPSTTHDFHAHLTLAYAAPSAPHPYQGPPLGVTFPALALQLGPNRVTLPLTGDRTTLAKADAPAMPSTDEARALYAQLTGDLLVTHHTGRHIRQAAEQLADGHRRNAATLARPIRDLRGSALEDAYLRHAEETNTAQRLRSVL